MAVKKAQAPAPSSWGSSKKAPTAFWLNATMALVLLRFLLEGSKITIPGYFEHEFGELEAMLVTAIVGVPAALYGWRRQTDAKHGKVE